MIITENHVLEAYKEIGRHSDAEDSLKYLKLKKDYKGNVRQVALKLGIIPSTALRWIRDKRKPYPIKTIDELKEKGLLPFIPNKEVARIIGVLHGDGFLYKSLLGFGVTNNDLKMILKLKKDIQELTKLKCEFRKIREKGGIERIYNKNILVKNPTYQIRFNSKAIGFLLYILGVPRGLKIKQPYSVPQWIMNGNKEIKKAFLNGLFDCEFSNARISSFGSHKENLSSPRIEMSKVRGLQSDLFHYLSQLKELLSEFNVKSGIKYPRKYAEGKVSLTLILPNKLTNILNFINNGGFYYSNEKKQQANYIKKLIFKKLKNIKQYQKG